MLPLIELIIGKLGRELADAADRRVDTAPDALIAAEPSEDAA